MGDSKALRSLNDVLLSPIDRIASRVVEDGPKWCAPVGSIPRIIALLNATNPSREERAAFAKQYQMPDGKMPRLDKHERRTLRLLVTRMNDIAGLPAMSPGGRQRAKFKKMRAALKAQ